jgi:hypothetical protein
MRIGKARIQPTALLACLLALILFGAPGSIYAQEDSTAIEQPAAEEEAIPEFTPAAAEEETPSNEGTEEEFGEVDIYEEEETTPDYTEATDDKEKASSFRPTIAPGVGLLTYYGELSKNDKSSKALVANLGYDLKVSFPLKSSYLLSFHILRGTVVANERTATRNLNFRSTITSGGFEFQYNFYHLLGDEVNFYPSVMVGAHAFEFLSKTDLMNTAGTEYHYWSDGTIRNFEEGTERASKSVRTARDYVYETDIRSQNLDGLGNYPERTFAFPVGISLNLALTDYIDFKLGSAMYFTLTDQLDGISKSGTGIRQGDNAFDRLLFSTFSLSYNLSGRESRSEGDEDMKDLIAMEKEDSDGDGIKDLLDNCPNTPEGVQVDSLGCPLDGDADGVANFKDQELETPDSMYVDTVGVGLTDEALAQLYLRYVDSTGAFAPIEDTLYAVERPSQLIRRRGSYSVGIDGEGLTPEQGDVVLGQRDVGTAGTGDDQMVTVGEFDDLSDAVGKQQELAGEGVPTITIIAKTPAGRLIQSKEVGMFVGASTAKEIGQVEGVIYRIQIGAFAKTPDLSKYDEVGKVIPISTTDGLTRVYHGVYNTYEEAAEDKQRLISMGFTEVLIKAFATKGVKVPAGGVQPAAKPGYHEVDESNYDANKVRFKVQVGSFSKMIPNELAAKFIEFGNVTSEATDAGVIRYFVGSFGSSSEARGLLQQVRDSGLGDAFLVGEYEGKTISVTQAKKLKGE